MASTLQSYRRRRTPRPDFVVLFAHLGGQILDAQSFSGAILPQDVTLSIARYGKLREPLLQRQPFSKKSESKFEEVPQFHLLTVA